MKGVRKQILDGEVAARNIHLLIGLLRRECQYFLKRIIAVALFHQHADDGDLIVGKTMDEMAFQRKPRTFQKVFAGMMEMALDEFITFFIYDQMVTFSRGDEHCMAVVLNGGEIVPIVDLKLGERRFDTVIEINWRLVEADAAVSVFR
ncbi:hypothetical protein ATN84_22445 [Paramesorhizobium deserti]|uniref:Uncharacterized protein n=1 Tax=Paramesorhizobium deserti TaxID=1494590 RepID=A0A135HN68_9HYPH|nr:hypothetical protein ATN84_22445 [Paramesorhizobium deserti]